VKAQLESQLDSQQNESIAQTISQQAESAHDALMWGMKQDPKPGIPQI
jgi:hypothetical protein